MTDVEYLPEALAKKHLPDSLKQNCVVVPKRVITWASVNVLILGIGLGMLLSEILSGWLPSSWLSLGFPISLGVTWLIAKLIITKSENRFLMRATEEK